MSNNTPEIRRGRPVSRRRFLRLLTGAAAGAGLGGTFVATRFGDIFNPTSPAKASDATPATAPTTAPVTPVPLTETAVPTSAATSTATATAVPPTETPSPVPSPTATETALPKTGYQSTEQGIIYRTEKGDVLGVPKIEGLRAELVTENNRQKVVYKAEEGNKYGLEADDYAGEHKTNVKTKAEDGKERLSGGVVLTSPVVRQLIKEKLATIPNQKDKWVIALPVDIRGLEENNVISVSLEKGIGIAKLLAMIRFRGEVPLVNVMPDSAELRVTTNGYYGGGYMDHIRLIDPYTDRVFPGKEMQYISVGAKFRDFSVSTTIKTTLGEKVSLGGGLVAIGHGAVSEYDDMTSDKILSVDKTPVFLAANSPK